MYAKSIGEVLYEVLEKFCKENMLQAWITL